MLHFELTLILLLVLVYCYAFDSLVVPFTLIKEEQWLSQDLILREIQHQMATISIIMVLMLPAMMGIHSKVLAVAMMILTVITQLVSVHLRSYVIRQEQG
jgi:hypothetical protein